jgi:hypothetical protein
MIWFMGSRKHGRGDTGPARSWPDDDPQMLVPPLQPASQAAPPVRCNQSPPPALFAWSTIIRSVLRLDRALLWFRLLVLFFIIEWMDWVRRMGSWSVLLEGDDHLRILENWRMSGNALLRLWTQSSYPIETVQMHIQLRITIYWCSPRHRSCPMQSGKRFAATTNDTAKRAWYSLNTDRW